MLISQAFAQTAPTGGGMDIMSLLPLILMFVLLYFLLLRPQMKRAKEHKQMISSLEIAPNVEITVQKPAVQTMLPKGTIKSTT